eukprot:CAMPEP_0116964034 /NCGR_PEP_ID=MMETSP0467-20121206/48299_1 /TAXON_ID=283647 /ORGANISM="Mesodinium pulex, Strain SPMC105" /LENGTH=85 /DNA_ID=CAMNT_0004652843 /DNA_START=131 /DNA_END=388 /DNA_ORIENTATION=+
MKLDDLIFSYTKNAAFKDPRFDPISINEFTQLSCDVSALHSFEKGLAWDNFEIGLHGVDMTYKNQYSATFLPQVMVEHQMDKASM